MFALRFGELNLPCPRRSTAHSRIILHRDVGDRLRTLAPFLHWERRPEVVVVGGRIQFLAHGYTTSNSFPYSRAGRCSTASRINYMRGAAVATVDAFSGRVTLYPTDTDDPILRAWRGAFPTLFTPASAHAGCRARPPALPARAVRRPVPGLGDLPHGQRRRLLHEGGRVAAAGRALRTRPEGRLDPLSLQAREPADARPTSCSPACPATATSGSCSRRSTRRTARRT